MLRFVQGKYLLIWILASSLLLFSCLSCVQLGDPMDCSTPGSLVLLYLLQFAWVNVHWISDAIQLSHPLLPPSTFPLDLSQHQRLESALHIGWPKYWSFGFRISPSNEYSGLISFRIDWFDLFAVQETLKSLLQHRSSKASVFSTQPSLWSSPPIRTWYCIHHSFDYTDRCW